MALYLGTLIFAFILSCIAIVPFIDFLYRKAMPRRAPAGGGLLVIIIVSLLYSLLLPVYMRLGVYVTSAFSVSRELNIIFLTFLSFASLGFISDTFKLNRTYRWCIAIGLTLIISLMLTFYLHIQFLNLPTIGVIRLSWWYLPFSTIVILAFTSATRVADRVNGLGNGLLLICLLAFWAVSVSTLDTPLSLFIALWIGSLIALLYFNVYPARILTGSAGNFSFGATLAVIGLLLGKPVALIIIGGALLANTLTIFIIGTPLHSQLSSIGWEPPKVMMRAWLSGIILAFFGLWLAFL